MADPILKLFGVGKDLVTSQMSQERGTQSVNTTISNGQIVGNVALTTAGVSVPHSLGRTPQGYIVVRPPAATSNPVVYETAAPTAQNLTLAVSAGTLTVSLWVF